MLLRLRLCLILLFLAWPLESCSPKALPSPTGVEASSDSDFSLTPAVRTSGRVVPANQINLSFPISGQINELLVKEGDLIRAGELIAWMDNTPFNFTLKQVEGALAISQANLNRVLIGASPAQIADAESRLVAAKAAKPATNLQVTAVAANVEAAQANLDYIKSLPLPEDVAVAQAEVDKAKADVESAKGRLKQALLIAPVDATVTRVFLKANEYAGTGQPVVQLSDLKDLMVEAKVSDSDAAGIHIGGAATIRFEALPEIQVDGVVANITPDDESQNNAFMIQIELKEIPGGLQWGMSADVDIPVESEQ